MNSAKKAAIFGIIFILLVLVGGFAKLYFLMFLGFIFLFVAWYFAVKNKDEFIEQSNEYFAKALKENNFLSDKQVFSYDRLKGLVISEQQKEIALLSRTTDNDNYDIKRFQFKDIIESKVLTNKQTVTSTSIESVATRGIIGGIVAGGIGSIIGGATAKTKSTHKIKELTLEIVVNDLLNPRYTINFYKSELELSDSSPIIQDIEEWYRMFSVIINRNSNEARSV